MGPKIQWKINVNYSKLGGLPLSFTYSLLVYLFLWVSAGYPTGVGGDPVILVSLSNRLRFFSVLFVPVNLKTCKRLERGATFLCLLEVGLSTPSSYFCVTLEPFGSFLYVMSSSLVVAKMRTRNRRERGVTFQSLPEAC